MAAPRRPTDITARNDIRDQDRHPWSGEASPPQTPLLTIDRASKIFRSSKGEDTVALLPVDGVIQPGEFVSFVGPSGCGKTTLLKICAGLVAPTEGSVTYKNTGAPINPGSFGIVFQNAALLPWKTVLDNVMLPADILGLPRKSAERRALDLLEMVQLKGSESSYPNELSGGMQQRVAIARSMLHDPDILFMDEPFGALDAMTREELNMELQEIHSSAGKTIVFVTHSISEAVLLSDRIMVFSAGPGRVRADEPVPLGRPRDLDVSLSVEFRQLEAKLRAELGQHRSRGSRKASS